jgi:hypothetical protein
MDDQKPRLDDERHDHPHVGVPQPASQPMSLDVARWYAKHTHGQLLPYTAGDGQTYLYEAPANTPTPPSQPPTPKYVDP